MRPFYFGEKRVNKIMQDKKKEVDEQQRRHSSRELNYRRRNRIESLALAYAQVHQRKAENEGKDKRG